MNIPLKAKPNVSVVDLSNNKYHMEEAKDPVDGFEAQEPKLIRTYSETEVNNFDEETGHRLYDDEFFRPKRTFQDAVDVNSGVSKIYSRSHGRPFGIEDEYIPGLNFSDMVYQWNDTPDLSRTNSTNSFLNLEDLHARVSPKAILKQSFEQAPLKRIKTNQSEFDLILDSLPSNFNDLPYSQRKKLVKSINSSVDYSQFSVYMKNSFGKKTLAGRLLSSTTDLKKMTPVNVDEKGAKVMEFTLGKVIGFGAWGTIRECANDTDRNNVYAMKIVSNKKSNILNIFKREIIIWEQLDHPNILKLFKYLETEDSMFCLMPRINGGTLFDLVSKWGIINETEDPNKSTDSILSFKPTDNLEAIQNEVGSSFKTLTPTVLPQRRIQLVTNFSGQLTNAIKYLHDNGIVHGDLKLENVLVDKTIDKIDNWQMILCDFGMSRYYMQKSNKEVRSKSSMSEARKPFKGEESRHSRLLLKDLHLERSMSPLHPGERPHYSERPLLGERSRSRNYAIKSMSRSTSPAKHGRLNELSPVALNSIESIKQYISDLKAKELKRQSQVDMDLPDSHIGSLPYASPELLLPNPPPLGPSADIWAFGILIYTMIMGKLPFQHFYEPRLRAMIIKGKYNKPELQQVLNDHEVIGEIISGCLELDITRRLDIDSILSMLHEK